MTNRERAITLQSILDLPNGPSLEILMNTIQAVQLPVTIAYHTEEHSKGWWIGFPNEGLFVFGCNDLRKGLVSLCQAFVTAYQKVDVDLSTDEKVSAYIERVLTQAGFLPEGRYNR